MNKPEWIALGYQVPATPSRVRVYVWRRLRALGAQTPKPAVAVLPNTRENLLAFEKLTEKIRELGGEGFLVEMNLLHEKNTLALREAFRKAQEESLSALLKEYAALLEQYNRAPKENRTALKKQLDRKTDQLSILSKQASCSMPQSELEAMANEVLGTLRQMPKEFLSMLRREK